jgi:hypothetical protein
MAYGEIHVQLHTFLTPALTDLPPDKGAPIIIGYEAEWAPVSFWMM